MKKLITYSLRLVYVLIIVFLCYGWWVTNQAEQYQTKLGPEIRDRYGFSTGTPMIRAGARPVEVLTLYPEPGGAMTAAGVGHGDILLSESLTGLYRKLDTLEDELLITVTTGGDGPSLNDRPTRILSVKPPSTGNPNQ